MATHPNGTTQGGMRGKYCITFGEVCLGCEMAWSQTSLWFTLKGKTCRAWQSILLRLLHWPTALSGNTLAIHSLICFSHSLQAKVKPLPYCNNRDKLNYPRTHPLYTKTTSIYLFLRRSGSRRERKLTRPVRWEEMSRNAELWCKHIIMLSALQNNHSASESHLSHSHCHFRLPNISLS